MKSPLIFRIFKNEQIHLVKQFVDKEQILFGHEADVDIDLDSVEVSSIHCLIEKRGNQYFICDLGSSQGTFKNGVQILDEPITSGDEFNIGPFRVIFFIGAPKPMHSPKPIVSTEPVSEVIIQPKAPPAQVPLPEIKTTVVKPNPSNAKLDEKDSKTISSQQSESVINETVFEDTVKKVISVEKNIQHQKVTRTPDSITVLNNKSEAHVVQQSVQTKPQIQSTVMNLRGKNSAFGLGMYKSLVPRKLRKTYAPESQIKDLREYIKPGKGQLVEVIVAWQERIINTYHFFPTGQKKIGPNKDIEIPTGLGPKNWILLDCSQGVQVRTNSEMKVEVVSTQNENKIIVDANYRLQQGEAVFITLLNEMQLIVRFAPVGPVMPLESPLILSASEFTGILAVLIMTALTSLIVSVSTPKPVEKEEQVERVAQVIFNKPPPIEIAKVKPPPVEAPKPPPPVEPPPPKVKPPEQPKKITESDKAKKSQTKGDPAKPDQKAVAAQSAGRANEVKPKDPKLKAKMFTSVKQGGAIKTGAQNGANAKSKDPDPTSQGLLAAFGSGGARSKLDKAYSGSGELLGAGEKATGASGFNESRSGDDLGSKFKDTGAGGKGTATQGIAGIGTKGRGTGMSEFGTGNGFGSKDQVAIVPGGAEEEFVGSIDKDAVRRVVRSALSAFKACYDRELSKDKSLEGKVVVSWEIHERGVAKNAKVLKDKSTIGNAAVEECVRSRMLSLRFPEPPGGTIAEVTYPFHFRGQK